MRAIPCIIDSFRFSSQFPTVKCHMCEFLKFNFNICVRCNTRSHTNYIIRRKTVLHMLKCNFFFGYMLTANRRNKNTKSANIVMPIVNDKNEWISIISQLRFQSFPVVALPPIRRRIFNFIIIFRIVFFFFFLNYSFHIIKCNHISIKLKLTFFFFVIIFVLFQCKNKFNEWIGFKRKIESKKLNMQYDINVRLKQFHPRK